MSARFMVVGRATLAIMLLALTACAPTTSSISERPDARQGLVLFVANPEPFYYGISILEYDPIKERVNWGVLGTAPSLVVKPDPAPQFVSDVFSPGLYAFQQAWQQGHWLLCLTKTVKFDIKAGEIAYLGILDTKAIVEEIERKSIDAGKTTASGLGSVATFPSDAPPRFTIPESGFGSVQSAQDYVNSKFPGLGWRVRAIPLTAATLPMTDNLFPGEKSCGR
jgi:hypothetical protein